MTFEEKLAAAAVTLKDSRSAGASPDGRSARYEPTFSDFDEEDYEEPERDTDYAAAYEDDDPEDDDIFARTPDEEGDEEEFPPAQDFTLEEADAVAARPDLSDDPDLDPDWEEAQAEDDDEEYEEEAYDEDYDDDQAGRRGRWPLGLIAVALVALLLLAAGGYGVVQERFAMQEQIHELNSALAAAASQAREAGPGDDLRALEQLSEERARTIEALTVENRRLTDMVAGLESQLEAQNLAQPPAQDKSAPRPAATATGASAPAKPAPAKAVTAKPPAATPVPAAHAPAATSSAAASAEGDWFVNFGSYSQSAAAQAWARRIKPGAGSVIVTSADRDGASFYRVRVVGLHDRVAAEKVSRQLEAQYGLPKLWVGRE